MDAALRRALKGGGDGTGDELAGVSGETADGAFWKAGIMKRAVRLFRDETTVRGNKSACALCRNGVAFAGGLKCAGIVAG